MSDREIQELTVDELAQNREGRVSPSERERLCRALNRLQLMPLLLSLGGVLGGTALVCLVLSLRAGNFSAMIATPTIGAALAPIYLTWWLLGYRRPLRELEVGALARLEGPIARSRIVDRRGSFFIYVCGTRLRGFAIGYREDRKQPLYSRLRELRDGKIPLRVFYLPRSRLLIAFEMPAPENQPLT